MHGLCVGMIKAALTFPRGLNLKIIRQNLFLFSFEYIKNIFVKSKQSPRTTYWQTTSEGTYLSSSRYSCAEVVLL